MEEWVRLCGHDEAPASDEVREVALGEQMICLANVGGELRALDNWCPHRQGPLGQGWVEEQAVVCPWHAWAFDTCTGAALPPERAEVKVFALKTDAESVFVQFAPGE